MPLVVSILMTISGVRTEVSTVDPASNVGGAGDILGTVRPWQAESQFSEGATAEPMEDITSSPWVRWTLRER